MTPSAVSGRYRGTIDGIEVELRIDIDGDRPLWIVSADYSDVSGDTPQYVRSMRLDTPKVRSNAMATTITGNASFSVGAPRGMIRVTIPRGATAGAAATLQHLGPGSRSTLRCACTFESPLFRHVQLEEACEAGVEIPPPFDTTSMPSRARPELLGRVQAYADVGIELASTGPPTTIDVSEAGPDDAWSDAELQAAMALHFSLLVDGPRWAIWLLHAVAHTDPEISGLMFDESGPERQGCAVFYGHDPATTAFLRRARLYNCVHELGHGFNLVHCWQQSHDTPPIPARPDAMTWMNYPERHAGGSEAFFRDFAFTFDDPEVGHLRHAFREDVIMGGNPFMGDGARDPGADWSAELSDPALRLQLDAPETLVRNDPMTVGLALSSDSPRVSMAPRSLDPRSGTTDIAIRRPDGSEVRFEPLLHHCRRSEAMLVRSGAPSVRDFAFIHYGKHGFAFAEPGDYRLQARYTGPDCRLAFSNFVTVRVTQPVSREDRLVSELVDGDDEVGILLAVAGSQAPALDRGNAKLAQIIGSYPSHPLAAIARLVQATSLARPFKLVNADGTVETRPADVERAVSLIAPVLDIQAVQRAAARATGEAAQREAFAEALTRVGLRPGVSPIAGAFLNTIRYEIATVRDALASRPPTPARTPPRRRHPQPEVTGTVAYTEPPKKSY